MNKRGCYSFARAAQAFLSLETPQERRALPYALLVDMEISADSSAIKLTFSHYTVTVHGSQLDELYYSIRAAECAVITPGKCADLDQHYGSKTSIVVTSIRVKRLQPSS